MIQSGVSASTSTAEAGTPVSSSSSRSAAARGSSPGSIPPCGICQAGSALSSRCPAKTRPSRFSSITPTPSRYGSAAISASWPRLIVRTR